MSSPEGYTYYASAEQGDFADTPLTDAQLALEFQNGHPEALGELYTRHNAAVQGVARRHGAGQYAEDVAHNVFLKTGVALQRGTPDFTNGARNYLAMAAHNNMRDMHRRDARISQIPTATFEDTPLDSPSVSEQSPEAIAAANDTVASMLSAVSPNFRDAVLAVVVEDRDPQEYANAMGIKLSTVRTRVHRGLAQARKALTT